MYPLHFPMHTLPPFGMALELSGGRQLPLVFQGDVPVGEARALTFTAEGITATVTLTPHADGGGYTLDYRLNYARGAFADATRIAFLEIDLSKAGFQRVFTPRREVWLPAGSRRTDRAPLPDAPDGRWNAENLIALYSPGGDAFLAGVVMPGRTPLEFAFRRGQLHVTLPLEHGLPAPEHNFPDALVLRWCAPLTETLEWYGAYNRITAKRVAHKAAIVAWNSWDWYGDRISQQAMLEAVRLIDGDPLLRERVNAIVLDDGWATWGDWSTPNERFPDLAGMAAAIRDAGYLPGIWYAPLRIHAHSRWAQEHPETALWGEPRGYYEGALTPAASRWALDPSHPLVQEKIYRELSALHAMGFRYFKTDFIQAPNSNFGRQRRYNPTVTQVEGVRQCMHAIRAAIGEDSFWLSCGTEILPVAGLPDAARVSDDIRLHFSSLQLSVRNCAVYFWANGALWLNDPDFLVVRGPETSTTPFFTLAEEQAGAPVARTETPYQRTAVATGPLWSAEEARTWTNFHIVYGGALSLGDYPPYLTDEARAMLAKAATYNAGGGAGVPLDLDERNLPARWLRPYRGGWLLGLFNFEDTPATVALEARDLARIGSAEQAVDLWSGEVCPWTGQSFAVELAPHASRVFHVQRGRE